MPIQIPNHGHCIVCGRAVEFGEKTCGPEDAAKLEETNAKRKRSMRMMYILMAAAVVLLVLQLFAPGFGG